MAAYRLKTVKYLGSDYNILLQNENGPCPLLAAANALILRGSIKLPQLCVSAGAASIDDVVNVLAERALENHQSQSYHLNEMMSIFPSLQYGMDVNPKFTTGVTGVEYTTNLTAFELLNVDLVHGWLLDPQAEIETGEIIGSKTYNELIEVVIEGNEAASEVEKLTIRLSQIDAELKGEEWVANSQPTPSSSATAPAQSAPTMSATDKFLASLGYDPSNQSSSSLYPSVGEIADTLSPAASVPELASEHTSASSGLTPEGILKLEKESHDLRMKLTDISQRATTGALINSFLQRTCHQLTQFGLQELYSHVKDDTLCVFFRNNHFSTLTKHDGVLYNLVTDLGYANVPQVVWEKLDVIDGDTEYMDSGFKKPAPQTDMVATASITGEQMLARQGQTEADLQLALQLSQQDTGTPQTGRQAELEEEERQMKAAMEESLAHMNDGSADIGMAVASNQGDADLLGIGIGTEETKIDPSESSSPSRVISSTPVTDKLFGTLDGEQKPAGSPAAPVSNLMMDQDQLIARQLQAQMEQADGDRASEALVQKLYAEETQRIDRAQQQQQQQQQTKQTKGIRGRRKKAGGAAAAAAPATANGSVENGNCIIS